MNQIFNFLGIAYIPISFMSSIVMFGVHRDNSEKDESFMQYYKNVLPEIFENTTIFGKVWIGALVFYVCSFPILLNLSWVVLSTMSFKEIESE